MRPEIQEMILNHIKSGKPFLFFAKDEEDSYLQSRDLHISDMCFANKIIDSKILHFIDRIGQEDVSETVPTPPEVA